MNLDRVIYRSDSEEFTIKVCSKCGEAKSLNCFGNRKDKKDGKSDWCRKCKTEYKNKWRKEGNGYLKKLKKKQPTNKLSERLAATIKQEKRTNNINHKIIFLNDNQYLLEYDTKNGTGNYHVKKIMTYKQILKHCKYAGIAFKVEQL